HDLNSGTDLFAFAVKDASYPTASGTTNISAGTNTAVTLYGANTPSKTANGLSEVTPEHSMSKDGRFTVFVSDAVNVVTGQTDTNGTFDVFLYDHDTNTKTLISHTSASSTTAGNGMSTNAVISADGKTVAFYSLATDLISGQTFTTGAKVQLYLYDN